MISINRRVCVEKRVLKSVLVQIHMGLFILEFESHDHHPQPRMNQVLLESAKR